MNIRIKRLAQALALATGSTLVTLSVCELGVRLLAPQQLIHLRSDVWCADHDGLGWRHTAGLDTQINTGERAVRFRTDARGYRIDPERADEAQGAPAWRVLALGDSFIEAIQVDYRDTVTAHLERGLERALANPGRVVNTGVGGWDPNHYLLEARAALGHQRYDAVLIFLYLGNDAVGWRSAGYPPRAARRAVRLRVPRSLGRGELIDAVAYPLNDALEQRSHLFVLAKNRLKFLLMRAGLSKHYFPDVLLVDTRDDERWQITAGIVEAIVDHAAGRGVPALAVLLPGVYMIDRTISERYVASLGIDPARVDLEQPARLLGAALAARGVDTVDTSEALRRALAEGTDDLYGRVDTHLGPAGHRVAAAAVLPRLIPLLAAGTAAGAAATAP